MCLIISCDYSDAFNAYKHKLDFPMRIAQYKQANIEFIQGSSSIGIAQWRQAIRRQEIGARICKFLHDSV